MLRNSEKNISTTTEAETTNPNVTNLSANTSHLDIANVKNRPTVGFSGLQQPTCHLHMGSQHCVYQLFK